MSVQPRKIAVIGAGMVGLSCALHLQRRGHLVDIFDPRPPGAGATLGNSGNIAIEQVLPFGRASTIRRVPRMLLDQSGPLVIRWRYLPSILPWLVRLLAASRASEVNRISRALATILGRCNDDWAEMVRSTGNESLLVFNGRLRLCKSEAALKALEPEIARQRDCGLNIEVVTAGDLRDLEPALAPVFAGGAFIRHASNLTSPLRMAQALAANFLRDGGRIHQEDVASIAPARRGGVTITERGGRSTEFERTVIAAGAWSRKLTRMLGFDPPLDTERGYHVMLATPPRNISRPVVVADPGYSLVPMEDGLRLASGVEFAGLDAPADFGRVLNMAHHLASILPGLDPTPLSTWLGFRPSMPQTLPVIGPLKSHPDVFAAFGHGHLGVTMAPTTGRLIADLVDGKPTAFPIEPYLPR